MKKSHAAIIGNGSWGTALAKICLENVPSISWYVRNADSASHLRSYGHNQKYLSTVEFARDRIQVSNSLEKVIGESGTIILAVPSAHLISTLADPSILQGRAVITAIKGLVGEKGQTVSQYLCNQGILSDDIAVVSGPCHAEEVAAEKQSYLTIGSTSTGLAEQISKMLSCRYIATSLSSDVEGIELAAVLKNIYAIMMGISVGLGHGDNFRAVLACASLREMSAFLQFQAPSERDILEAAYTGDSLVTFFSQFSRNRSLGIMVGKGYSVSNAILEMNMVAEGYPSLGHVAKKLGESLSEFVILSAAYSILYLEADPRHTFAMLAENIG